MVVPTVLATIARSRWVRTAGLAMALEDMRRQLPRHQPVNLFGVMGLTPPAALRWPPAGGSGHGRPGVSRAGQLPDAPQLPAPAPSAAASWTSARWPASSILDGAVRTSRPGMNSSAIIAMTAQPIRYQLIQVLEPVALRMAAAMSGAGPPAMTEASW